MLTGSVKARDSVRIGGVAELDGESILTGRLESSPVDGQRVETSPAPDADWRSGAGLLSFQSSNLRSLGADLLQVRTFVGPRR
jgi:hypothetical protein